MTKTETAAVCGATNCIWCKKHRDPSFAPRRFPSPCTMAKGHRGHCWPGADKALLKAVKS